MSEYVMVPVPEEFVDEVTRYVQWTVNSAEREELDDRLVLKGVRSLDEPSHALLAFVVDAVLNGRLATLPELARILQCSPREVLGTMLETNQRMRTAGAPIALMPQKAPGAETLELEDQVVVVWEAPARSVAAALLLGPDDDAPPPDA